MGNVVMVNLVQSLDDDGAEPDADVGSGHVHQSETSQHLVAMNAHLWMK